MFSFRFREEELVSQWGFTFKGMRHSKGRRLLPRARSRKSRGRKLTSPNRRC